MERCYPLIWKYSKLKFPEDAEIYFLRDDVSVLSTYYRVDRLYEVYKNLGKCILVSSISEILELLIVPNNKKKILFVNNYIQRISIEGYPELVNHLKSIFDCLIIDFDDRFQVPSWHPFIEERLVLNAAEKSRYLAKTFDIVTIASEFPDKVDEVIPSCNLLFTDMQCILETYIRSENIPRFPTFGYWGGSYHSQDIFSLLVGSKIHAVAHKGFSTVPAFKIFFKNVKDRVSPSEMGNLYDLTNISIDCALPTYFNLAKSKLKMQEALAYNNFPFKIEKKQDCNHLTHCLESNVLRELYTPQSISALSISTQRKNVSDWDNVLNTAFNYARKS